MMAASDNDPSCRRGPRRMVIFMPSWVGDVVMAMPSVRALRAHFPKTHISALLGEPLVPLVEHCPWVDQILALPRKGHARQGPGTAVNESCGLRIAMPGRRGMVSVARWLRIGRYDLAVLFPNSFRTAMLARMAGIPCRVGYDRDARGLLLTDRLIPRREKGRYVPVSAVKYYLAIARYLGAAASDGKMALFTDAEADSVTRTRLAEIGVSVPESLVVLTPGANFGAAKLWPLDRFAAVADHCHRMLGLQVAVAGSPQERPILEDLCRLATEPVVNLQACGFGLGEVMSTIKQARLVVTNDTGPRHIAAAFATPVVSIFGPTDPAWTDIAFREERQVMVKVFCGPCQLKRCPLDHRCMTGIDPSVVIEKVHELLDGSEARGCRHLAAEL